MYKLEEDEQMKSENEVVERVTINQEWSFRAKSAKGQQLLNCDCFVF